MAVVIDATVEPGRHVSQVVVGLVLVGMVPVDELMARLPCRRRKD